MIGLSNPSPPPFPPASPLPPGVPDLGFPSGEASGRSQRMVTFAADALSPWTRAARLLAMPEMPSEMLE